MDTERSWKDSRGETELQTYGGRYFTSFSYLQNSGGLFLYIQFILPPLSPPSALSWPMRRLQSELVHRLTKIALTHLSCVIVRVRNALTATE